ncbi:MAG: DUF4280 domain-containing protein [Clostridiales bacterium]|nr:DUF4280 domain-containing protein [Clostridiales bacterium]
MANPVVNTALCACSFGTVPGTLTVTSQATVQMCGQMAATIMDNQFPTFGMCSSPMNPPVASTGIPTPCKPVTVAPWTPGCPTVLVCGKLLLNNTSVLTCGYGGVIQVTMTPAVTVQVP